MNPKKNGKFNLEKEKINHENEKSKIRTVATKIEFERKIYQKAAKFINLDESEKEGKILEVLQLISEYASAVRSSIFILSKNGQEISNTHEWCKNPADSQKALLQNIPADMFGHHLSLLKSNKPSIVSKFDDLPEEAISEREWVKKHGFRSLIFVPMFQKGKLYGTLGFYGEIGLEIVWDDNFVHFLHIISDIVLGTIEHHRIEKELVKINKELERSIEKYQMSNEDMKQFAYIASHDLKEPLRMIESFLDLVKRRYTGKILDPEAGEYIDFAIDGAKRLTRLINNLLQISILSSRNLHYELVDCNDILKDTMQNLKIQIDDKKAQIKSSELPTIKLDKDQFTRLLQNLLNNALKFNKSETPKIFISYKEGRDEYTFEIKDNGIGINKKYSDMIFKIFNRLDPKEKYSGSGIGLAICKRIVERHQGKIWFESEKGKGTTFYFTLSKNL